MITPPEYLSPSSINTFRDCPQKFFLSRIERIQEPPQWHLHLGTFVHEVLETMYKADASERTEEGAKKFARQCWDGNGWKAKVEALENPKGSVNDFMKQAFDNVRNIFRLENPATTELDGMEHEVNTVVEGVAMKGFIDRFTFGDNGIVISDYKTGKVPNPRFKSQDDQFFQLLAYALMLKASEDEDASHVQLLYLSEPVVHQLEVTPERLIVATGTIVETKEALDAACAAEDFHCNVTKLCDWCFYKSSGHCPAWKGKS
ncbi:MAG: RecB family exonuclease [Ilumatobacteraceae bacterium]